jgi:hypothetical protein
MGKAYESRDASLAHARSQQREDERFAFARTLHRFMLEGGAFARHQGIPPLGGSWRAIREFWPNDLLSLPVERRSHRPLFIRIVMTYWPDTLDVDPSVWAYFGIGSGLTDPVRGKARFDALVKDWRKDIRTVAEELGLERRP